MGFVQANYVLVKTTVLPDFLEYIIIETIFSGTGASKTALILVHLQPETSTKTKKGIFSGTFKTALILVGLPV